MLTQFLKTLKDNKLFLNLKLSELPANLTENDIKYRAKGSTIYSEGDSADSIFLVLSGDVEIQKNKLLGVSKTEIINENDFFGEEDYLETMPRTSTAIAATDCQIIKLENTELEYLMNRSPRASMNLKRIPYKVEEDINGESNITDEVEETPLTLNTFEEQSFSIENNIPENIIDTFNPVENVSIKAELNNVEERSNSSEKKINNFDNLLNDLLPEVEEKYSISDQSDSEVSFTSTQIFENIEGSNSIAENAFEQRIGDEEISEDYQIAPTSEYHKQNQISDQASYSPESAESVKANQNDPVENINEMRKEKEENIEHILREERIKALERMSSFLVQDIRKPILVSKRFAEHLKSKNLTPDTVQVIDMLLEQLNNVQDIIQTTTGFATNTLKLQLINSKLHTTLDEILAKYESGVRIKNCELLKEYEKKEINVLLDKREFAQCCMHLIRNACDAMPEGGKISVSTMLTSGNVQIRFKDSGKGIPEELKGNIFDPLVSSGEGTGIGLSIAKKNY